MAVSSFSNSGIRSGVKRNKFWDQSAVENSFFSIETISLSSSQSPVTFSNIPQTYTHLQIRGIARTDRVSAEDVFKMRLNSDTTETNYYNHYIAGDGGTAGSYSQNNSFTGVVSSNSATTQIHGVFIIDILDYTNTNKFKTSRILTGNDRNGGGQVWLSSQLWKSTSAVTSVSFIPNIGSNFMQYSHFALYGIKG